MRASAQFQVIQYLLRSFGRNFFFDNTGGAEIRLLQFVVVQEPVLLEGSAGRKPSIPGQAAQNFEPKAYFIGVGLGAKKMGVSRRKTYLRTNPKPVGFAAVLFDLLDADPDYLVGLHIREYHIDLIIDDLFAFVGIHDGVDGALQHVVGADFQPHCFIVDWDALVC